MGRHISIARRRRPTQRPSARCAFTRVRAVLAAALVGGVSAAGVQASWSGSEFAGSDLETGTFALVSRTVPGAFTVHGVGEPAEIAWQTPTLFPGQSVSGWVQLQSTGTVPGVVRLSGVDLGTVTDGSPDAALRDALIVRISTSSTALPAAPECNAETPGSDVTGLGSVPPVPAVDLQPAEGNTVTFCIVLTLPADAPAQAQGGLVRPVWVFTGSST